MTPAERKLLLAIANGMLGDFQADRSTIQARRNALAKAIEDGAIDDNSPLARKRPTLAKMDAALLDADAKIATIKRLIGDVEA